MPQWVRDVDPIDCFSFDHGIYLTRLEDIILCAPVSSPPDHISSRCHRTGPASRMIAKQDPGPNDRGDHSLKHPVHAPYFEWCPLPVAPSRPSHHAQLGGKGVREIAKRICTLNAPALPSDPVEHLGDRKSDPRWSAPERPLGDLVGRIRNGWGKQEHRTRERFSRLGESTCVCALDHDAHLKCLRAAAQVAFCLLDHELGGQRIAVAVILGMKIERAVAHRHPAPQSGVDIK